MNATTTRLSVPVSPGTMPSSIASLASGGGASDAAVPATSAANISSVRPRYGRSSSSSPRSLRPRPPVARQRRTISSRRERAAPVGALTAPPSPRSIGLRVRNTWSGSPFSAISAYSGERLEQLGVRAARGDPAVLEHDDLVGERDRREPVRDHERRPPGHHLAQRDLDRLLGRRVDRRRRVVEDQDPRVAQQRARDRDPLALAARERQPALADARVVARRQLGDEAGRLRALRRPLDLLARRLRAPVGDVLVHASR